MNHLTKPAFSVTEMVLPAAVEASFAESTTTWETWDYSYSCHDVEEQSCHDLEEQSWSPEKSVGSGSFRTASMSVVTEEASDRDGGNDEMTPREALPAPLSQLAESVSNQGQQMESEQPLNDSSWFASRGLMGRTCQQKNQDKISSMPNLRRPQHASNTNRKNEQFNLAISSLPAASNTPRSRSLDDIVGSIICVPTKKNKSNQYNFELFRGTPIYENDPMLHIANDFLDDDESELSMTDSEGSDSDSNSEDEADRKEEDLKVEVKEKENEASLDASLFGSRVKMEKIRSTCKLSKRSNRSSMPSLKMMSFDNSFDNFQRARVISSTPNESGNNNSLSRVSSMAGLQPRYVPNAEKKNADFSHFSSPRPTTNNTNQRLSSDNPMDQLVGAIISVPNNFGQKKVAKHPSSQIRFELSRSGIR